jgi:predicted amidohydrolase
MWRNAQLGHAASNCVFVASLNRVGREDRISFWGGSFIAGPNSEILAKAGAESEILIAACDLDTVKPLQDAWMFLNNRRPEAYGDLTRQ